MKILGRILSYLVTIYLTGFFIIYAMIVDLWPQHALESETFWMTLLWPYYHFPWFVEKWVQLIDAAISLI